LTISILSARAMMPAFVPAVIAMFTIGARAVVVAPCFITTVSALAIVGAAIADRVQRRQ